MKKRFVQNVPQREQGSLEYKIFNNGKIDLEDLKNIEIIDGFEKLQNSLARAAGRFCLSNLHLIFMKSIVSYISALGINTNKSSK